MNALRIFRRASREVMTKTLALPPGFRRIMQDQKVDANTALRTFGSATLSTPIQNSDPSSPDFGKFFFMVGYDQ